MEKTATTAAKRPYEVVLIVHPDTPAEEQKELFRKNQATIKSFGGDVFSVETWGKRNLANPIKKTKKGIYFHSLFEASPAAIMELERTMRINDRVLRFMHSALDVRIPLSKHMEAFKKGLQETAQREKEREAKIAAKRAAMASERAGDQ
jgi:small subunit ribosomal protein S6